MLHHGYHGRLPIELRGVRWAEVEAVKDENDATLAEFSESVERLNLQLTNVDARLRLLEDQHEAIVEGPDQRR